VRAVRIPPEAEEFGLAQRLDLSNGELKRQLAIAAN
jgi:hypothetical protein